MYELSALRQDQVLLAPGFNSLCSKLPVLDPVGQGATFCKVERNLGAAGAGGRAHRAEEKPEGRGLPVKRNGTFPVGSAEQKIQEKGNLSQLISSHKVMLVFQRTQK